MDPEDAGAIEVLDMENVTFADLDIRMGTRYLYCHLVSSCCLPYERLDKMGKVFVYYLSLCVWFLLVCLTNNRGNVSIIGLSQISVYPIKAFLVMHANTLCSCSKNIIGNVVVLYVMHVQLVSTLSWILWQMIIRLCIVSFVTINCIMMQRANWSMMISRSSHICMRIRRIDVESSNS